MALVHGYVTGELIYSRADGPDGDRLPDVEPATDVKLTFTPAARQFVDPNNRLVVADQIPAAVMPDGQVTGDVDDQGNAAGDATAGLWLVVGKYRVTAKGHYRDFDITVTEDHTENNPLVLGEAVEYVPPTVTVQSVTVPQGAANGQVLGWQDGLAWVTGGEGGGGTVAWADVQDKPDTFPPDLTGVSAADVGARPDDWEPDLSGYATTGDIADFITDEDLPDLSGYATTSALNSGLASKANTNHDHDGDYLSIEGVSTDSDNAATLGTDGLIYVPESSGGGDVASVNGQTGTVVLNAADVGARPDNWNPDLSGYATTSALSSGLAGKQDAGDYVTATELSTALSGKADSGDLATVATTGSYDDLDGAPTIPTQPSDIGAQPAGSYATAAQGAKADTAVQPAAIADFITSVTYNTLPAGTTLTVHHDGTNWPPRPTPRLDIPVTWVDDAGTFGIPSEFKPAVDALLIPSTAVDPEPPAVTPLDVYNFEDQTNGQALTTGGDWSSYGTGPLLATNSTVAHGTLAGHMANASPYFYLDYHPWSESPSTEAVVMECYLRIPSSPGANMTLMQLNNSGTNQGNVRLMGDGTIKIRDTTTEVDASSETLALNTWYRIAWLTSSSGQEVRVYEGESTTPYFTLTGALTDNTHTSVRIGATAAAAGTEFYIDTIRVATEWLAPAGA